MKLVQKLIVLGAATAAGTAASAQPVMIQVTVENLAPTNSISYAPLRVGFGNGAFDSFNEGEAAGEAIVSVAEGGSGSAWFPAFEAADPGAVLGTVLPDPAGPLLPGQSGSAVFTIDPATNQYFSFAAMVVPSNDYFIGNDDPMAYRVIDDAGNLLIGSISQTGADIWDAGSEVDGAFGAAFLMGSDNGDHIDENGVVTRDFMDLDVFNGLETAAGYIFDRQFGAGDEVYRISFEIVPAPGAMGALAMGGLLAIRRRR
ncbi:MAG: spondin domain-containing protein [Phycisphaerales bacterium JB041]